MVVIVVGGLVTMCEYRRLLRFGSLLREKSKESNKEPLFRVAFYDTLGKVWAASIFLVPLFAGV